MGKVWVLAIAALVCGSTLVGVSPVGAAGIGDTQPGALVKLTAAEVREMELREPGVTERFRNKVARDIASSPEATAAVSAAAPSDSSSAAGYWARIHNFATWHLYYDRCLAIPRGEDKVEGAHAAMYNCTSDPDQIWWVDRYWYLNKQSEMYLAIPNSGGSTNGTHVIQWSWTGSPGQRWFWQDGVYIRNDAGDQRYMAIPTSQAGESGVHAIIWTYTGASGQAWFWSGA